MSQLSWTGHRWTPRAPADGASALLAPLPPLAARCIATRPWAARTTTLQPSIDTILSHDPMAMHQMAEALERVRRALRDGESILVVTDYDVDGTTSSLILQHALQLAARQLGTSARIAWHIPDRFEEGYGFSLQAARAAVERGHNLVITADIGVRDHAAIAHARNGGVDVLICDHHLPDGADVPADASAVLCPPQAACAYPNPALAACGVSLKLSQALLADHPRQDRLLRSFLKLAAIGTVADVVDLSTPENRAIVGVGLEELRKGPHSPGLAALIERAGLRDSPRITAADLGFRIGPRINAAGRLIRANAVVELLNERDPVRARARALELDQVNQARRSMQERLERAALEAAGSEPDDFIVVWGQEDPEHGPWHRGIVGIVAARLRDRLHRPTAVVATSGAEARGSVRSVPGVHAVQALDSVSDLLVAYGGHPVAAGFTVATADLPELRQRLAAWTAERRSAEDLVPVREFDCVATPEELTRDGVRALMELGPFGKGNPRPVLLLEGVRLRDIQTMGSEKTHLRASLGGVKAVWWKAAAQLPGLQAGPVDLLAEVGFNHFRGRTTLQLDIRDARDAATG
jgi:single-stranded-DNA-specific exonuclease